MTYCLHSLSERKKKKVTKKKKCYDKIGTQVGREKTRCQETLVQRPIIMPDIMYVFV
jgi:hypothetical protein